MDRRRFLRNTALTAAAAYVPDGVADDRSIQERYIRAFNASLTPAANVPHRRAHSHLRIHDWPHRMESLRRLAHTGWSHHLSLRIRGAVV